MAIIISTILLFPKVFFPWTFKNPERPRDIPNLLSPFWRSVIIFSLGLRDFPNSSLLFAVFFFINMKEICFSSNYKSRTAESHHPHLTWTHSTILPCFRKPFFFVKYTKQVNSFIWCSPRGSVICSTAGGRIGCVGWFWEKIHYV